MPSVTPKPSKRCVGAESLGAVRIVEVSFAAGPLTLLACAMRVSLHLSPCGSPATAPWVVENSRGPSRIAAGVAVLSAEWTCKVTRSDQTCATGYALEQSRDAIACLPLDSCQDQQGFAGCITEKGCMSQRAPWMQRSCSAGRGSRTWLGKWPCRHKPGCSAARCAGVEHPAQAFTPGCF